MRKQVDRLSLQPGGIRRSILTSGANQVSLKFGKDDRLLISVSAGQRGWAPTSADVHERAGDAPEVRNRVSLNLAFAMKTPATTPEAALQDLRQSLSTGLFGRLWQSKRPQAKSLLELLDLSHADLAAVLRERLAGLEAARDLARTPIIGVCGTVNSGKSTLVASFLSEANRPRVLIGDCAEQATQQFVFWLPESARKDAGFLGAFSHQFQAHFCAKPAWLSEHPDEAAQQVNATSEGADFALPLLAFDPRLESHHLGFLDCPDIQRIDEGAAVGSNPRLHALIRGARLCSAFVVVTSQEQLGAHTVPDLLRALNRHAPGLPLYLAVNKAGAERVQVLADASAHLQRWGLAEQVRDVFHAAHDAEARARQTWPEFRNTRGESLATLPGELALSDLGRDHLRSALHEMGAVLIEGEARLRADAARGQHEVDQVSAHIGCFLARHFLDDKSRVRLLYSAGLTQQLLEAMERTAPMEIWLALQVAKPVKWLQQAVSEGLQSAWRFIAPSPEKVQPKDLHAVAPGDFVEHMLPLACLRPGLRKSELQQVWEQALQALAEDGVQKTELEPERLDPLLRQIWGEVPFWKRLTFAAALPVTLITLLATVIFLSSIDFGASAVMAASLPELVTSVGLGLVVNQVAMSQLNQVLETRVGLRQLANLHAVLLDGLGLPRAVQVMLHGSGRRRTLPEPNLAVLSSRTQALPRPIVQLIPGAEEAVIAALATVQSQLLSDETR